MKNFVLKWAFYSWKSHARILTLALAVVLALPFIVNTVYASADDNGKLSEGIYRMSQNLSRLNDAQKRSMTGWKQEIIEFSEEHPDNIILNTDAVEKIVALTFDDGPDSSITSQIIDVLKEYEVKATFFFVGDQIEKNVDVLKKAYDNGFQIANHSYTHPHFTQLSDADVLNEINDTVDLIEKHVGVRPTYIRPPYGDLDERTLELIGDQKTILWSIDTVDWANGVTASEISDYIMENIQPGDIVLMHSSSNGGETLKAVPLIIEGLREMDYEFCTVAELVGAEAYTK